VKSEFGMRNYPTLGFDTGFALLNPAERPKSTIFVLISVPNRKQNKSKWTNSVDLVVLETT